jgi:hypothetical protein
VQNGAKKTFPHQRDVETIARPFRIEAVLGLPTAQQLVALENNLCLGRLRRANHLWRTLLDRRQPATLGDGAATR